MSMQTEVESLNNTFQKTHEWLRELKEIGHYQDTAQAYTAFRAVLHSLRDRLTPEGAVHLGAQLPMLVRGFYYEGWKLSKAPNKERSKEQFLDSIRGSLHNASNTIDAENSAHVIFHFLEEKISEGEIKHVKAMLPEGIKVLWH